MRAFTQLLCFRRGFARRPGEDSNHEVRISNGLAKEPDLVCVAGCLYRFTSGSARNAGFHVLEIVQRACGGSG